MRHATQFIASLIGKVMINLWMWILFFSVFSLNFQAKTIPPIS